MSYLIEYSTRDGEVSQTGDFTHSEQAEAWKLLMLKVRPEVMRAEVIPAPNEIIAPPVKVVQVVLGVDVLEPFFTLTINGTGYQLIPGRPCRLKKRDGTVYLVTTETCSCPQSPGRYGRTYCKHIVAIQKVTELLTLLAGRM